MKTNDLFKSCLLRVLVTAAGALFLGPKASFAQTNYPAVILADHPSAYYRFEETSGTTAADSSTNGIAATYVINSAGSPIQGEPGIDTNSLLFTGQAGDSTFGEVEIPAGPQIMPMAADGIHSAPFSAELWVQPTTSPSDYEVPLEVGAYPNGWNIYISPGPGASYFIVNMPGGVFFSSFGAPVQFLNWYHLVFTYDGTNETFYINGVSTGTYPAGLQPATGLVYADVGSGQQIYSPTAAFKGGIDEVAFYTYVLSPSQVTNHYAVGTNSFRPGNVPAGITTPPVAETNYSGVPVTFAVTPSGTSPFTYTWSTNGTVTGSSSSTLTFTPHYPGDNNDQIQVIVSNLYGGQTSSPVSLTVLTNANILSGPPSITRNVGSHAAFHVTANGALPITYQWFVSSNGGPNTLITPASNPTAASDTLWLSNVQLAQNGNQYSVSVINPFGSNTAMGSLSVQTRSDPPVSLTGYGAIVAADNPVAFWRMDETSGTLAEDAVGTFDGAYAASSGTVTFGAPTGIPHSSDTGTTLAGGATVQMPWAAELNPDTAWSVELWLQPSSLGADNNDYRVVLSSEYNYYPFAYNGWYIYQEPGNVFGWVIQPANAFVVAGPDDPANSDLLVAGKWYHLVITDDTTNFNMYINGELRSSAGVAGIPYTPDGYGINPDGNAAIPGGTDNPDDGGNFVIGQRTDGAFNTFEGSVADAAVYQYALSPTQVKLHYLDATQISIARTGTNVVLTWPVGVLEQSTNVAGPYTPVNGAASPYTNAAMNTAQYFIVHVP